jgi:hypothetical protein
LLLQREHNTQNRLRQLNSRGVSRGPDISNVGNLEEMMGTIHQKKRGSIEVDICRNDHALAAAFGIVTLSCGEIVNDAWFFIATV